METSEECREREEEELMCVWKVRETGTLQPRAAAYLRDDLAVEREVSTAVGARIDALTVQVLLEDPPHCCKNYATRTTGVVEKREKIWDHQNLIRKYLKRLCIASSWRGYCLDRTVHHASSSAAVPKKAHGACVSIRQRITLFAYRAARSLTASPALRRAFHFSCPPRSP